MTKFIQLLLALLLVYSGTKATTRPSESAVESIRTHLFTLSSDSMRGRCAGSEYSLMAAEYIAKQFAEIGLLPLLNDSFLEQFKIKQQINAQNVVGLLRGTNPQLSNEYIVIGAHYDHLGYRIKGDSVVIFRGADDNASGVAALIETARMLTQRPPERSVIFIAFDAHEQGLYGSRHFVGTTTINHRQIKLMLSLDMVGYLHQSKELIVRGCATLSNGQDYIAQLAPNGLNVNGKKFETSPIFSTDTEPFANIAIPTLAVTTGKVSPYHTPRDTPDRIDCEGIELICRYIARIADATDLTPSGKISYKHMPIKPISFGVMLYCGSNHHYYRKGTLTGKRAFAGGVGLFSRIRFHKILSIQPEIAWQRRYAKTHDGQLYTDAIMVPINIILHTPNTYGYSFFMNAGGYYAYNFAGHSNGASIDFKHAYNRHVAGLSVGFGLDFNKLTIMGRWHSDLTQVLNRRVISRDESFNGGYIVSIGYRF